MPIPTTAAKISTNFTFITVFRLINSGKDKPVTAILKVRAVPIQTPFSVKTLTRGIIPAVFEYKGIPISTANGTAYQLLPPAYCAIKSAGTYPCIHAPTPTPSMTNSQIFLTILKV